MIGSYESPAAEARPRRSPTRRAPALAAVATAALLLLSGCAGPFDPGPDMDCCEPQSQVPASIVGLWSRGWDPDEDWYLAISGDGSYELAYKNAVIERGVVTADASTIVFTSESGETRQRHWSTGELTLYGITTYYLDLDGDRWTLS
ncbi:hypothetical protein ACH3VR_06425 [Microbacterium sp. B2969]|uniref:Lipoprotein n=1 Tax=Microbacterium alkaliflavum TaxID=3248839 RepID=A0ABW7Q557_9MICO